MPFQRNHGKWCINTRWRWRPSQEIIKFITCIVRKFNDANDVWFLSKEFNVHGAFAATAALRCCSMDFYALHQSRRETTPFHFPPFFSFLRLHLLAHVSSWKRLIHRRMRMKTKNMKKNVTSSHGALATNKRRNRIVLCGAVKAANRRTRQTDNVHVRWIIFRNTAPHKYVFLHSCRFVSGITECVQPENGKNKIGKQKKWVLDFICSLHVEISLHWVIDVMPCVLILRTCAFLPL